MLIALGAAGVTLAVVLGVIGIPVVNACSADPRGVVTCLRDMADRKFDLPGTVRGTETAPVAVLEQAEPTVVVGLPPAASSELQADETEALLAVPPELPAAVTEPPITAPARAAASPVETAPAANPPAVVEMAAAAETPAVLPVEPAPVAALDTALAWDAPKDAGLTPAVPLAVAPEASVARSVGPPATAAAQPEPVVADPAPSDPTLVGTVPAAPMPRSAFDLANAEPAMSQPPAPTVPAPVILAPTIDAIELDGAASFVSGTGPAGALMRLFADGKLVGESPVEEGRWLVEGRNLLDSPRRELRVEAIDPETGELLGAATITVEIELPDGGTPPDERPAEPPEFGSGVAPTDVPAPAPEAQVQLPEVTVQPPELRTPEAVAPSSSAPVIAGPEPEAAAAEPAIDTATAPDPIVPDPLPELAAVTPSRGSASVEILGPSDLQPTVLPPVDDITHDPATIPLDPPGAPAVIADLDIPTAEPAGQPVTILRLLPFGDPDEGRYNVGKAIIRHGDTLWSIARRYYGHGIHYRTIFHANRDLIRRPSRIFPGQIFDLPLVTDD